MDSGVEAILFELINREYLTIIIIFAVFIGEATIECNG
jgi:hypothetical protein